MRKEAELTDAATAPSGLTDTKDAVQKKAHDYGWSLRLTVATACGVLMVGAGAVLAYNGKPEGSLIWTGAALIAVGTLGSRLQSLSISKDGVHVELQKFVRAVVEGSPEESCAMPLGDSRMTGQNGAALPRGEGGHKTPEEWTDADWALAAVSTTDPTALGRLLNRYMNR